MSKPSVKHVLKKDLNELMYIIAASHKLTGLEKQGGVAMCGTIEAQRDGFKLDWQCLIH